MLDELKPCPFCGGAAKVEKGPDHGVWIDVKHNNGCGIWTVDQPDFHFEDIETAIVAWNRRSPSPPIESEYDKGFADGQKAAQTALDARECAVILREGPKSQRDVIWISAYRRSYETGLKEAVTACEKAFAQAAPSQDRAYLKASELLHKLEARGVELTDEEDELWQEAEALYQSTKAPEEA